MFKKEFNTEPEMRAFKREIKVSHDGIFENYVYSHEKRRIIYILIYKRNDKKESI